VVALLNRPRFLEYFDKNAHIMILVDALWFIVIIFVIVWASSTTIGQSSSSATIVHICSRLLLFFCHDQCYLAYIQKSA